MKFKKQLMQEIQEIPVGHTFDFDGGLSVTKISDDIVDKSRWCDIHDMVFKVNEQYFSSDYRQGSTEDCSESPYEYDDDEIECEEVVPTEKTIIVYVPKKVD